MQWEDDQTIQNCFISSQVSCCKNGEPPSENQDPKTKTMGINTQKRRPENEDSHAIIPSHPFPFSIHHFYTSHNAPYLPPKVLHNLHCYSHPKRN